MFYLPTRVMILVVRGLACMIFLLTLSTPCQVYDSTQATIADTPGHQYAADLSEIIDPGSGSLSIRVFAPEIHERGVPTPTTIVAFDSSGLYKLEPAFTFLTSSSTNPPNPPAFLNGTWIVSDLLLSFAANPFRGGNVISNPPQNFPTQNAGGVTYDAYDSGLPPPANCHYAYNFVYTDQKGGRHPLNLRYVPSIPNTNCSLYAGQTPREQYGGDGEYFATIRPGGTAPTGAEQFALSVFDSHGNQLNPQIGIEDTNGNLTNGSGRTYVSTYDSRSLTSLQLPGINGPWTYSIPALSGTPSYAPAIAASEATNQKGCSTQISSVLPPGTRQAPAVVTLPDGRTYTFSFDMSNGFVNRITYPNGAWTSFEWGIASASQGVLIHHGAATGQTDTFCSYRYDWPVVKKKTTSYDGSSVAYVQSFDYQTSWPAGGAVWSSKVTTVTTTDFTGSSGATTRVSKMTFAPLPLTSSSDPSTPMLPALVTQQDMNADGLIVRTKVQRWTDAMHLAAECLVLTNGSVGGNFYRYLRGPLPNTPTLLVTDETDYDYGTVNASCDQPSTTPLREVVTDYATFTETALHTYLLDRPKSVQTFGNGVLLRETETSYDETPLADAPGTLAHDDANYGAGSSEPRGNATTITRRCLVPSCQDSTSRLQYDILGNLIGLTDADGQTTTFSYEDSFAPGTGNPPGNTRSYETSVTRPITNGTAHVSRKMYGYTDGKVRNETNENGQATVYCYTSAGCQGGSTDTYSRLTGVLQPDGGTTRYTYNDQGPRPSIISSIQQSSSRSRTLEVIEDASGHEIKTVLSSDPEGADFVDTTVNSFGLKASVSSPYRSQAESTYGTSVSSYDPLGRVTTIIGPDGSKSQYCYDGIASAGQNNCQPVLGSMSQQTSVDEIDEHQTHWQYTYDILGRLTSVVERLSSSQPKQETDYSYDALGNLLGVMQKGVSGDVTRRRSFAYDGLSRLIMSTNPEAGTMCYGQLIGGKCVNGYDPNGNLLAKTDARGITTSYQYDVLNRLTKKSYSDGTRPQSFAYDGKDETGSPLPAPYNQNAIGRLSRTSDSVNVASSYGYDSLGRLAQKSDCLPARCDYSDVQAASYDLAGNMTSFTYPDGRTVSQAFDAAGRVSSVGYQSWNGNQHAYSYLSVDPSIGYDPAGHVAAATMGNGTMLASRYDNRQRINWLAYGTPQQLLWGRQYAWTPNSNLQQTTDMLTGVQRQFGYDGLNRLTAAQDIVGSSTGADTSGFAQGNGGLTGGSSGGSTAPPASPQWTDPDDSNVLMNPDTISSVAGTGGWDYADVAVAYGVQGPDGSATAYSLTASQGATDGRLLATASSQYMYDNETMTASVWLRSPGGPKLIGLVLVESTGSAYDAPAGKQVTVTTNWQQFSVSGKYLSGRPIVQFEIGGGGSFTSGELDIWGTKLEDSGQAGRTVTNFLPYSQRFTAGGWGVQGTSVSDNSAPAPDGSNTAAILTANAGTSDGCLYEKVANPATFTGMQVTGSVWLRSPSGLQNIQVYLLNNGSAGYTAVANQLVTIGSQWTRVQITGRTQSTLTNLQFQIGGGSTFAAGQSIQVWGAQLELGASAGQYVPTGSSSVSVGTNLTNFVTNSSQMSAPTWFSSGVQPPNFNAVTAPDGTNTGLELTSNSADGWIASWLKNPQMLEGATVTGSVYLRAPAGTNQTLNLYIAIADASDNRNYVVAQPVSITGQWQRYSFMGTLPNAFSAVLLQIGAGQSLTSGQMVDIWGPQIELSSTAGIYVPTTALSIISGQEPTNLLRNSQLNSGPGWSMNAVTSSSTQTTAPNGTQTAVTLTANNGATDAYIVNDVANPSLYDGLTVTGSVYLKVPSGTLNLQLFLASAGSGAGTQVPNQLVTLTTSWQRFSLTTTLQNGLFRLWLQIGGASSYTSGQTIQIWGAQMVTGSSAGVYDPTTTTTISPVTGAPATLVVNGLNDVYGYDSFGNMTRYNGWTPNYDAGNHIVGWPYDAAGNQLSNGLVQMRWDAESRISAVTGASYLYDADGNRVESSGSSVTDTVYFNGRPMSRLQNGQWTDLIYGPTGLIAEVAGQENADPQYRLVDHLGTNVGTTDQTGLLKNPLDYNPFGQIRAGTTSDPYFFTGKERDQESGLDYFGARYYGSSMGRWMSPDPSNWGVDFYYPQTWNHYSYVANNPLSNTDPNGLWLTPTHNSIINNSFPGLSKEQRQILQASSKEVDTHQGQEDQFMHGMDSTHNNVWEGAYSPEFGPSDYIQENEQNAKDIQAAWIASGHTGIAPGALAAFGNALHTITDEYSPSHTGFQMVHWYSYPLHWREGLAMVGIYGNSTRSAQAAARQAFYDVFGSDLGQQATHEKVTVKIIFDPNQKLPDQQQ